MPLTRARAIKIATIFMILVTASVAAKALFNRTQGRYHPPPAAKQKSEPSPFRKADEAVGNEIKETFVFTDQDEKPFELNAWFDKPLIISYIFTECPYVCPTISTSLAGFVFETGLKLGEDFRIVTVGFDTKNDTPQAMREFGEAFIERFDHWKFVTGKPADIRRLAEAIGVAYSKDKDGAWQHTMAVTIMGPGGVVFKQVFGVDYTEKQLAEPLKLAATGVRPLALKAVRGE